MYKQRVTFANSILDNLGGPKYYKSEELSMRDRETARDAIALWLMLLWDKCISSLEKTDETHTSGLAGRILSMIRLIPKLDLYDFLFMLDLASQYLLDTTTGEKPMSFIHFKRELILSSQSTVQQEFCCTLTGLVKRLSKKWFCLSDEAAFRDLRAIFCFLGRLSLKDVESLRETALDGWFETEFHTDWNKDYSGPEREVISEWFPIEDTAIIAELYAPKHGAGSTYEHVTSTFEKCQRNEVPLLVQQVETILGFDYWTSRNVLMASPTPEAYKAYVESDPEAHFHRVTCVPKNWKTYRIISMEEIGLMFAQQGAMVAIFDYLKLGYSEFSKHYCVNTEHLNRNLARVGSIDGAYATIDMSHASDSVAWKLVERWFSKSCLAHLIKLRSKYAVLDTKYKGDRLKDVYEVSKFAPMGSALCFPIECIVFGAIVEAILRKMYGRRHNKRWYVYGDDLVVPVEIVNLLIIRLKQLGFEPNSSKSYFNLRNDRSQNLFRESCGGEYLNGIDVTPPRIPRKFEGLYYGREDLARSEVKVRSIAKLVTLANDLFEHSPTARYAIVHRLISDDELHLPILMDTTGERGIRSTSPSNYHLKRKINIRTQTIDISCLQLRLKRKSLDLLEECAALDELIPSDGTEAENERFFYSLPSDPYNTEYIPVREIKEYREYCRKTLLFERERMWQGLGPVLLYEYLRLAQRKDRDQLIAPEDAIEVVLDPRSYVMTLTWALVHDECVSQNITSSSDWSYSNWNTEAVWSGTNSLVNHRSDGE